MMSIFLLTPFDGDFWVYQLLYERQHDIHSSIQQRTKKKMDQNNKDNIYSNQ